MRAPLWFSLLIFCATVALRGEEPLPPAAATPVEFDRDIRPLLRQRCSGCHGAALQQSGLRLDQKQAAMAGGYSGPVIQAGKSAESTLIHRVAGFKDAGIMPPAGKRLTAEEVGLLRAWIDQGAKWPDSPAAAPAAALASRRSSHWAFQPVQKAEAPPIQNKAWVRTPVDAFILARLEQEHVNPSPEADKRTLLRRLSLDLTGLPPTPREIAEWLADTRPDAYERQVDRLLASPHYGEKWARHWLDRARYADSDGYEKDWVRPWAWRYRQWVIDAYNQDKPFDQFTVEQIAGDLLPHASQDQRIATGFHRQTLTNREGGVDNLQFRFENTIDRAATVGSVWMGLTVGCAQCHDHKYDPISQKEFYQLYAFFDPLEEVDIDAPLAGEWGPYLSKNGEYRTQRDALLKEYNVPTLQAAWEKDMLQAAAEPGKRTDWDLAWDCLLKLTETGDGEAIMRIPPAQRTRREQDILTDHFIRNYHFAIGQKRYKELKFDELDKKVRALKESFPALSQAMVVAERRDPQPTYLRVRGNYKAMGIPVVPAGLGVLPPMTAAKPTRLDLARWLVSPQHPLTSRVAVNSLWQELFGQGLVRSTDDFGIRGDKPSHPELLDWLASQYIADGWSTKRLLRTLVTSAVYRQASAARPDLTEKDPGNTLLARQTRLRLPAELVRDSALSVSGLLSDQVGGKSVRPPQPAGVTELGYAKKDDSAWTVSTGPDRYRRGLYIHLQRSTPYPQLVNFDAPKATVALCRRERSNTPLQALNLLNDPVFVEAAEALAYQLLQHDGATTTGRLQEAFETVVARPPSPLEEKRLERYLAQQQAIFARDPKAAAQLSAVDMSGHKRDEAAAWVAVCSVLLNLDEFITRE